MQHSLPVPKEQSRILTPRSSFRKKSSPLRPSHSPSPIDRPHPQRSPQRGTKKAATIARDEYDSDATVDLDEGTASHLLRETTPLQRMTSEYERLVLRSISQGKSIAFTCACSLAANKRKVCPRPMTAKLDVTSYDEADNRCESSSDEDSEADLSGNDYSASYDEDEYGHSASDEGESTRNAVVLRHRTRGNSPQQK